MIIYARKPLNYRGGNIIVLDLETFLKVNDCFDSVRLGI